MTLVVGVIYVLIGVLCLGLTIKSYNKYNRISPINISNTIETSFSIDIEGDYVISVEGVNHGQITKEMVVLNDLKNNLNVEFEPIEHLKLKNRYQQKFYNNIFKFVIDRSCSIKMIISEYKYLKTHHSKYKLVEQYSKDNPPIILIHRFYPMVNRLRFILFFIGSMFLLPIGIFLIFKN
ncbi:hypothetical protein [Psychroserpens sp. MEBiC05023]